MKTVEGWTFPDIDRAYARYGSIRHGVGYDAEAKIGDDAKLIVMVGAERVSASIPYDVIEELYHRHRMQSLPAANKALADQWQRQRDRCQGTKQLLDGQRCPGCRACS